MDIEKKWKKALADTEIIRSRVQSLMTTADTHVPYVFLAESSINMGDTIVRKGEVIVRKPTLFLPPHMPQFEGFDFNTAEGFNENSFINFLFVRGICIPSMYYNNHTNSLDIYEGKLSSAIKDHNDLLQKQENVSTGLLAGPEDCWQFSLLIFICSQIARNVHQDIQKLLEEYHRKKGQH